MRPSATVCPTFYGLPKIHKPNVPLRPNVASIGSPRYTLAKYLAEIFKPVVGKTEHHVVNSKEFVTKMEQIRLGRNDILVSFDVVSLFTNVPVEEACNIAKEILLSDITLSQRTNLSPENVHDLLKVFDHDMFSMAGEIL